MGDIQVTARGPLGKAALREANERVLLSLIRRHPGISRFELSERTGLSPSAVTGIVDRLNAQDLLVEKRADAPGLGRPRIGLTINADARCLLGVEITSTEATVALADLDGRVLEERVTPFAKPPEVFLAAVREAIVDLAEKTSKPILGCGVSIPGNFDASTGRIRQATNLHWHDVEVLTPLAAGLPFPLLVENNANLSALAERWFGGAPDDFVFVTLRVGLGAGLLVEGRLVRGARQSAGEFGHMTLFSGGRKCLCGNVGCWEEYASDRALVRLYREKSEAEAGSLEIVKRAGAGDAAARAALQEAADALALGLGNLMMGLNPASIAVDDWAAVGWDLIKDRVWRVLEERVPAAWRDGVEIFPSLRATHASLAGALALVLARFYTSFESEHEGGRIEMGL